MVVLFDSKRVFVEGVKNYFERKIGTALIRKLKCREAFSTPLLRERRRENVKTIFRVSSYSATTMFCISCLNASIS